MSEYARARSDFAETLKNFKNTVKNKDRGTDKRKHQTKTESSHYMSEKSARTSGRAGFFGETTLIAAISGVAYNKKTILFDN